jgi:hypothetical protein
LLRSPSKPQTKGIQMQARVTHYIDLAQRPLPALNLQLVRDLAQLDEETIRLIDAPRLEKRLALEVRWERAQTNKTAA